MSKYDLSNSLPEWRMSEDPSADVYSMNMAEWREQSRLQAAFCEAYEAFAAYCLTYHDLPDSEDDGPWHDVLQEHQAALAAAWAALQAHFNGETT